MSSMQEDIQCAGSDTRHQCLIDQTLNLATSIPWGKVSVSVTGGPVLVQQGPDGKVVVQDVRGRYNANNQGRPFQRNNARGNGVAGNEREQVLVVTEQSLFLAGEQVTNIDDDVDDSTENDLALNVDHIFEADECDAFDSDVDEGPTSQTMFIEVNDSTEASVMGIPCVVNILDVVHVPPPVRIVLNKEETDIGYPRSYRFMLGIWTAGGLLKHNDGESFKARNFVEKFFGQANLVLLMLDSGLLKAYLLCRLRICLLSKASKSKSWLWHRRLNHLNFGTINDLARKDLYCSEISATNGVVERSNRTLVDAVCTMMIFSKAPMFSMAEAVAHACYIPDPITNSILVNNKKKLMSLCMIKRPDLTFLSSIWCSVLSCKMIAENPEKISKPKRPLGFSMVVPPGTSLSTTIAQDAPSTSDSSSTHPIFFFQSNIKKLQKKPIQEGHPNHSRFEPRTFKMAVIEDAGLQAICKMIFHGIDRLELARIEASRIFFANAGNPRQNVLIYKMDVKTAFLNGDLSRRSLYNAMSLTQHYADVDHAGCSEIQAEVRLGSAQEKSKVREESDSTIPVSSHQTATLTPLVIEALAGPDPEPMQEDQTGSDSGKVYVSLAGPNPEHMDDEFLATAYPKVHENLRLITDERIIEDNPESHSGSMSSMKNLEDTDNFGDQFLYDKPSKVIDESDSIIPDPSHQTVMSTPPVIAPITNFSSPKPSSLVTPPPINTEATTSDLFKHMNKNKSANRNPANYHLYHALMEALIAYEDAMDKEDEGHVSDLEDTDNTHIPKVSTTTWFKLIPEGERPATPEPEWTIPPNDFPEPENNWANTYATTYKVPAENKLQRKTYDIGSFIKWFCRRTGKKKLCKADLEGPAFNLVKAFHKNNVFLQYQMDECHKLLTNKVDMSNPEGHQILRNIYEPLPLGGPPGQVTIQPQFFFNKDLDYLLTGDKERKIALSISKLKAARYLDFGLEELVPSLWVESEREYDISAVYGITHWWFRRKEFYINKHSEPSDREAVRSQMRILSVISVKISEKYFKNLHPNDFEDLFLLNIQEKLNHLPKTDKTSLHTAVNMWIRNLVIRNRVGDLQLGIESYQTKINLERPNWDAADYYFKEDYTIVPKPRAVVYRDRNDQRKLMRLNELHKFSDGTLTRVMEKLDHMVKDFHLFEYNKGMETRKWSEDDKRRSKDFITAIEKRLQIRRIYRSLESFVGGRIRDIDYRLINRTTNRVNSYAARITKMIADIEDRHHGPKHPSETIVFHNEDGNPARANIKQALGYLKDGDGDGNSQFAAPQIYE
ncbi:retrovirus-related pol polyprotein from transposon TNT 1-94 [Tanacetum coccineum]